MAAFANNQRVAFMDVRLDVLVAHSHLRKSCQNIQPRHAGSRMLNAFDLRGDRAEQIVEQRALQRRKPFPRPENLVFQFFQLGRDVALRIGERLLTDKVRGNLIRKRTAYLNVIAEDAVESDLQRADARLFLHLRLKGGEIVFSAVHDAAELVHFRVRALPDHAAVLERDRRILVDQGENRIPHVFERINLRPQRREQLRPERFKEFQNLREMAAGRRERIHFARRRRPVHDTGHEPLHVEHLRELRSNIGARNAVGIQFFHRIEPGIDRTHTDKRLFEPRAQQTLAHCRLSFVKHPEERPLLLAAAHGLRQFQIGARDRRKLHILCLSIVVHRAKPLYAVDLRAADVFQQCAERAERGICPGDPGLFLPGLAELTLHLFQTERLFTVRLVQQLYRTPELTLDVIRHTAQAQQFFVHQNFAGRIAAQFGDDLCFQIVARQARCMSGSRRNIGKADTRFFSGAVNGCNVVVLVILQHALLNDRAGSDNADDIAFDKAFGGGGIFHLLTDGNFVPFFNQPRHVRLIGMERHAAHRRALLLSAVTPRERELEFLGREDGVVKKHFIEISETEKQNLVRMLFFHFGVLLHHRRQRHCDSLPCLSEFIGSVASAAGGTAAGASADGLFHRHRVSAVDRRSDDRVDVFNHRFEIRFGLVVGLHAFVLHDVAVQFGDFLVQRIDLLLILAFRLGQLAVQIDAGKIEVADEILQSLIFVVALLRLHQGNIFHFLLKLRGSLLKHRDRVFCHEWHSPFLFMFL